MPSTKRKRTTKPASAAAATTPPSSAIIVAENDDVLTEILLRLPVKSLQRFKSVSKHWLSLISNPVFSARRTPHPGPISGLILDLTDRKTLYGPEYDFVDPNKSPDDDESLSNPPPFRSLTFVDVYRGGIAILQSCNGLLLCVTSGVHELRRSYYVYNPTTRKHFTVLPQPEITIILRMNLAFDPSKSPHYKVVCLCQSEEARGRFRIEIYSSETRSWRRSSVGSFAADFSFPWFSEVYWNGSVHWINSIRYPSLSFDVDEDRLREMPMPLPRDNTRLYSIASCGGLAYFGDSRGHLYLVYRRFERVTTCFNVYEMEKDCSGWFVKYRVDLAKVSAAFPEMVRYSVIRRLPLEDYALSILCIVCGECEEDSYMVMHVPGKILRYNFRSETFYKLCDSQLKQAPYNQRFHSREKFPWWYKAYQYIESLSASV